MNLQIPFSGWTIERMLAEDGSARRYYRARNPAGRSAVLMEVTGETPGHRIVDFIRIADWLRSCGVHAPEIYEQADGFLLLEDFGDVSFKKTLEQGAAPCAIYGLAHEALSVMQRADCPLALPLYYDSHVHARHRFVIDWYAAALAGQPSAEDRVQSYLSIWQEIERGLPPCPQGFLHIDYHTENLMMIAGAAGLQACGILDFQGGMIGPLPYDLANLLEDVRYDVPSETRAEILAGYDETYRAWYRVLGTQFHCRVIGQFIKMAVVDGKNRYLDFIPRTASYIDAALRDPLLARLQKWFAAEKIAFDATKSLKMDEVRRFMRDDKS